MLDAGDEVMEKYRGLGHRVDIERNRSHCLLKDSSVVFVSKFKPILLRCRRKSSQICTFGDT